MTAEVINRIIARPLHAYRIRLRKKNIRKIIIKRLGQENLDDLESHGVEFADGFKRELEKSIYGDNVAYLERMELK
jgi:hypothetical protein